MVSLALSFGGNYMREILQFLSGHPALAIFFSLAVGYCIGKIKIGSFTIGPTIGTLLTAFILSRFTEFAIPGILSSIFYAAVL